MKTCLLDIFYSKKENGSTSSKKVKYILIKHLQY